MPLTRESHLQLFGFLLEVLDPPVQDASHFSQLALRDEYLIYTDIIFAILRKDVSSLTKNVVSSAKAVDFTSVLPILNPQTDLLFRI